MTLVQDGVDEALSRLIRSGLYERKTSRAPMAYHNPRRVDAPRRRWKLIDILYNGGNADAALAIGEWDGKAVLAARWNGTDGEDGIGNPQSRGIPTWFVLPQWLNESTLMSPVVPRSKVRLARALLNMAPSSASEA